MSNNQIPVYYTKSIELTNNLVWKKNNLKFVYFSKAGHALDPRDNFDDLNYRVLPTETLNRFSKEVSDFFSK